MSSEANKIAIATLQNAFRLREAIKKSFFAKTVAAEKYPVHYKKHRATDDAVNKNMVQVDDDHEIPAHMFYTMMKEILHDLATDEITYEITESMVYEGFAIHAFQTMEEKVECTCAKVKRVRCAL